MKTNRITTSGGGKKSTKKSATSARTQHADPSGPAAVVAIRLAPAHQEKLRATAKRWGTSRGGAVRRWLDERGARP